MSVARVQIPAYTDRWMMGDRFGNVVRISRHRRASKGAGVRADASVMVGDSLAHDIEGARAVGMRPVLLHRADGSAPAVDVPVIRSLAELPELL